MFSFFSLVLTNILLVGLFIIVVDWLVHIDMTKGNAKRYGWAGYKQFKREFHKAESELIFKEIWRNSLFSEPYNKHEFHANIIKFNSNGMVIHNPISLFLVKRYVNKYISKNYTSKNTIKW